MEDLVARELVGLAAESADAFDPANKVGLILCFHAGEFFGSGTVVEKFRQFFVQLFFHLGQVAPGFRCSLHKELPGDFVQSDEGIRIGGNLVVVHETLVEAGGFPNAQDIAYEVEIIAVGRSVLRDIPNLVNARLRDAVLHFLAVRSGHFCDPSFLVRDGRTRRNVAKIFFDFFFGGFGVDVARQANHHVGGTVVGLKPFLHVVHGGSVEIGHLADDGPGIRMVRGIRVMGDELKGDCVGLVFTLALFVLDDTALQIESLLIERAEEITHAVGFHPQGVIEGRCGHVFEVVSAVVVGGAVQVGGADFFHGVNVTAGGMFAAAEHQVLEEMREAGFARLFVFRADVVPEVHGDDGRLMVFVDNQG